MSSLYDLLQAELPAISSLSAVILQQDRAPQHATVGLARQHPVRLAIPDQVYDLASLTKALVTSPVCASLCAQGLLDPHAPIHEVLPDAPAGVTAYQLLCHAGGFPAHVALHKGVERWGSEAARQQILDAARAVPLVYKPGSASIYSDVGFLVLLQLVETLTNERIDRSFARLIAQPADVPGLTWGCKDAAATEVCPIRDRLVQGLVHDPNTSAMGGVSSHAGLFGSAREVARLCSTLLAPPPALASTGEVLRSWWKTAAPGTHRGGWDTPSTGSYTSTGGAFPAGSVGHLGYTGTSMWMHPDSGVVVVLLSNRIHPVDDLTAIRAARPRLHQAIGATLGWPVPTS